MSNFDTDFLGFDPSQLDVFNQKETKSQGNPLIYKTSPAIAKSEDGHYRCTIKVVYNPFNPKQSVLEQQSYAIHDKDGWLTLISALTINETKLCPIFKAWKRCHYADPKKFKDEPDKAKFEQILANQAIPKDKGGKGLFDKRFARYVVVQVLEDENQPEKVGKFLFWKCPKAIWTQIDSKIHPAPESKKAKIPVMDYLFGNSIELEVIPGAGNPGDETYGRDTKYIGDFSRRPVSCINPDGSPMLNDSEQTVLNNYIAAMEPVWDSKDPAKRAEMEAAIKADPNTAELGKIYNKVLTQIKSLCPNIDDELSYKPWNDAINARVDRWIKIVLMGNDPDDEKSYKLLEMAENGDTDEKTEVNKEDTKTEAPTSTSTSTVTTATDDPADDLPF